MSAEGFLKREPGFATRAIHDGQKPEQWNSNALVPPITMSTTFKQLAPNEHKGYVYGRSGGPSRDVIETCLASIEGGKHALTFSSGLGATASVVNLLNSGDHIVCVDDVYGGTHRYFRQVVSRMGIDTTFVDGTDANKLVSAVKANTKLVWVESPTNPLMKVTDIKKAAELIHKRKDIILVVDNSFLTCYFQQPLKLGADIVSYSVTKYINGHTDIVMGALVMDNNELYERLKFLQNAMGIVPSPFDCALVNRSLKTLHVRMEEHQKNGFAVAKFLESHPLVEKVIHPGLPSHPQYEITKKQTYGHSGMLSFYLKGGLAESRKFLCALKVFILAESLGGYKSLAELPSLMTHASIPEEERIKIGITDSLIRLSVGIECTEDLIADLDQALKAMTK